MQDEKIAVKPWQRVISFTLAIIATYFLIVFFLIPFAISALADSTPSPRIQSIGNLRQITIGLGTYATDHKEMPDTLSELVPEYLDDIELFYLKPHSDQKFHPPYPTDASDRLRLLDALSPYHFTHYPKARLVVVHETPGIWKIGKMAYFFLELDGNDLWHIGGISPRSPQKFRAALHSKLEKRTPSIKSKQR